MNIQTHFSAKLPIGFRDRPGGAMIRFSKHQHRVLARYFAEQRKHGRSVLSLEVIQETGIEQWQGRMSEMRASGFAVLTVSQSAPRKGDRRKLFILSGTIELIYEEGGFGNG